MRCSSDFHTIAGRRASGTTASTKEQRRRETRASILAQVISLAARRWNTDKTLETRRYDLCISRRSLHHFRATDGRRGTGHVLSESGGCYPGFPFCQPDQGLYTPTRLSARQISSAHVIPLPTPVSWGRARRETDWSPCFQGISQAPLHTCALSSPLRCTQAARQPPGTGSAQILRSMSPNSRRVR